MTEEELREKIAELEHEQWMRWAETLILSRKEADIVLTLIREAGWRSPEQIPNAVICPYCDKMHWIKEPQ